MFQRFMVAICAAGTLAGTDQSQSPIQWLGTIGISVCLVYLIFVEVDW